MERDFFVNEGGKKAHVEKNTVMWTLRVYLSTLGLHGLIDGTGQLHKSSRIVCPF